MCSFWQNVGWATLWAFFLQDSSGHPGANREPVFGFGGRCKKKISWFEPMINSSRHQARLANRKIIINYEAWFTNTITDPMPGLPDGLFSYQKSQSLAKIWITSYVCMYVHRLLVSWYFHETPFQRLYNMCARFFMLHHTKKWKKLLNHHKIYQMAMKHTKWF
jgi:hypothetical protein